MPLSQSRSTAQECITSQNPPPPHCHHTSYITQYYFYHRRHFSSYQKKKSLFLILKGVFFCTEEKHPSEVCTPTILLSTIFIAKDMFLLTSRKTSSDNSKRCFSSV
jgi:hypothetical protein